MPTNIMGCGTMFMGQRDYRPDGSYVTTEFATLLFFPLAPIRSCRVIEAGHFGFLPGYARTAYRVQDHPLCLKQVASIYATLVLCITSVVLFTLRLAPKYDPRPMYSHEKVFSLLFVLSGTWPIIVGGILRVRAKRLAYKVGRARAKQIEYEVGPVDESKIITDKDGNQYVDISDYGTLSRPPSDEANEILSKMSQEEQLKFTDLLRGFQTLLDSKAGTPGMLFHPDIRAAVWGVALAKIADGARSMGRLLRALFFMQAAWNLSRYPVFAFHAALLACDAGDNRCASLLLQGYLAGYREVPTSPALMLVYPRTSAGELESMACSARAKLATL